MNQNLIISSGSVKRLVADVTEIIKNPLTEQGIYYEHDEENMLRGYAMIIGPKDTIYWGGYYFFEFKFPYDYPYHPPTVRYCTNDGHTRFNPNLYKCGKVCLSVLNTWRGDQWTGCQTISSILLVLCTALNERPLLNEPGVTKNHRDYDSYSRIIEFKNYSVAINDMLTKTALNKMFERFYNIMVDIFLINYEDIIASLAEKKTRKTETITTCIYKMSVVVNYKKLFTETQKIYNTIKKN